MNVRAALVVLLCLFLAAAPVLAADRAPAMAGKFYPADAKALGSAVDGYLAAARVPRGERPVAIVAPHAGYPFCGRILGEAYHQVEGQTYDLVVVLGTNHTLAGLSKAAVWPDGSWTTPLGAVRVDVKAAAALRAICGDCIVDADAHTTEHSIEVQLPFIQKVLPGVPILPIVIPGEDPFLPDRVGPLIASVVKGRRALIVASSDLSHYPAGMDAERIDKKTLEALASLDAAAFRKTVNTQMRSQVPGLVTCACGEAPILTMLSAVKAMGTCHGDVVAYANSAEAPGADPSRAVGYGAVAVTAGAAPRPQAAEPQGALAPEHRRVLLAYARDSIRGRFEPGLDPSAPAAPALQVKRGAFVTLKKHGELRGCIGHMEEDLPLAGCVNEMALAAAFEDHRFEPLAREELDQIEIEISVLTVPQRVKGPEAIVLGRDGVILRKDGRSAVFLPQVAAEQGWDRSTMLSYLAMKAGLASNAWKSGAEFLTFQAEVFGESDLPR